jgi:nicotinate-nucleotide--dimethylbenzimidazole phosphoribosyltransferase
VVVFAGDHGVVADGASAWPSDVTAAMAATIASKGAAINAFAATVGAEVTVVDVGVASDVSMLDNVVAAKVRAGTASIVSGPAMTLNEVHQAMSVGAGAAVAQVDSGADLLIAGEMGIGNSTASAAIIAAITGAEGHEVVGSGAGVPADGIGHKTALIDAALLRSGRPSNGDEILAQLGGLEIAALAGWFIAAASCRVPFIVDGVISMAALCVAERCCQGVADLALFGHQSTEPAAEIARQHLGASPLLWLSLRLGEGTGACLAVPLVQAAARALNDMADLPA